MLLGLDTQSFRLATGLYEWVPGNRMRLLDLVERAVALKLSGIQIADPRLLQNEPPEVVEEARNRLSEAGMYVEVGASGTNVEALHELMDHAKAVGANVIRTFVGADRSRGWAAWRQQQDRAVEDLRQAVPLLREQNLRVAVENHGDLTSPELVNILDKVGAEDAVGVCFDTGKSLFVVEDPLTAAQNLAPYVITACLTDYRLISTARGAQIVGCALGNGAVDLLSVVQVLRQKHEDVHLNVESPVVSGVLPFLEDRFWDSFYDRGPRDLAAIIRLIRRNNVDPSQDFRTPVERDRPEAEVINYEADMFERSVQYAKDVLLPA